MERPRPRGHFPRDRSRKDNAREDAGGPCFFDHSIFLWLFCMPRRFIAPSCRAGMLRRSLGVGESFSVGESPEGQRPKVLRSRVFFVAIKT